jgi:hypothetical protein
MVPAGLVLDATCQGWKRMKNGVNGGDWEYTPRNKMELLEQFSRTSFMNQNLTKLTASTGAVVLSILLFQIWRWPRSKVLGLHSSNKLHGPFTTPNSLAIEIRRT